MSRSFIYIRVFLVAAVTFAAFYSAWAWVGYNSTSRYFGVPRVAAYSATAPSPAYLQPVAGISAPELLEATNRERVANNLPPLTADEGLYQSASAKCQDMTTKHYWSHHAPDGTSGLNYISNNYPEYFKIGENLATGYYDAESVVAGWMNSPSHRAALLNQVYSYVGFGVCEGDIGYGPNSVTVVQHFLAR